MITPTAHVSSTHNYKTSHTRYTYKSRLKWTGFKVHHEIFFLAFHIHSASGRAKLCLSSIYTNPNMKSKAANPYPASS